MDQKKETKMPKKKVNKLGLPIYVGPKSKTLMDQRIQQVEKIIKTKKSLIGNRPLNKKDLAYARKHLAAYKWQRSLLTWKKLA